MPIETERDFENAMQEYQRLKEAPASSEAKRRLLELDAEIKAFNARSMQDLAKGKPRQTDD